MRTLTALTAVCLALLSATAPAAHRGTSLGDWRTGDFSAPDLVKPEH